MAETWPGVCSGSAGTCTALLQALRSPCCGTAGPWDQAAAAGLCDRVGGGSWGQRDGAGVPAMGLVSWRDWSHLCGRLGLDANPSSWGHSPPSPAAQASRRIYLSP